MEFKTVTACFFMLACLFKLSDAAFTAWAGKQGSGTDAIVFAAGNTADDTATAFSLVEGTTGTLFKVTATSGDTPVTYAITSTPSGYADTTIAVSAAVGTVDEGTITLAAGSALDFETATSIVFVVVATDSAGTANVGTASVTITVTDKVEFTSTVFCLSGTSLASGASVGTLATDTSSAVIVATLLGTDAASFAITTAGALTSSAALTTNTKTYYTFTASATDATITDSGNVDIHVLLACSSGAGQIAALVGVLVLSVANALIN